MRETTWQPGPACTAGCEPIERWLGGTLISRHIIHRHGAPIAWGGYDTATLGIQPHDRATCQPCQAVAS